MDAQKTELLLTYQDTFRTMAYKLSPTNPNQQEDLTQQMNLSMRENDTVEPIGLAIIIAKRNAIDYMRSRAVSNSTNGKFPHVHLGENEYESLIEYNTEHDALDRLQTIQMLSLITIQQREMLCLYYICGYTMEEIADFFNCTHSWISKSILESKQKLKRRYSRFRIDIVGG